MVVLEACSFLGIHNKHCPLTSDSWGWSLWLPHILGRCRPLWSTFIHWTSICKSFHQYHSLGHCRCRWLILLHHTVFNEMPLLTTFKTITTLLFSCDGTRE